MLKTLLFTLIFVAIAFILLSVGVIIKGKFANTHVSANREMQRRGIHCAQTQDREARRDNPNAVKEKSTKPTNTNLQIS